MQKYCTAELQANAITCNLAIGYTPIPEIY